MNETVDAMHGAVQEIKRLRQRNEVLQAKADTLDIFAGLIGMASRPGGGEAVGVDPLWNLERRLGEIIQAEKTKQRLRGQPLAVETKPAEDDDNIGF